MQRFFDIVFSGLALLLLAPLLVPVALVLRFTGENEVFFLQKRMGFGGEQFEVYKFATMLKDSPNIGSSTVTVRDDPRVLPFGKFLRRTKINELPQLINVFKGDMSVIGPRPLVKKGFDAYDAKTQKIISSIKPGLSGVGSLVFRNEEQILHEELDQLDFYYNVIAPYKGQLEQWYRDNQSIFLYLNLILLTVVSLVSSNSSLIKSFKKRLPKCPTELERYLS